MPLVKFTGITKSPVAIEASLILYVGKGKGGVSTQIQTGIQTPQGIMGFEVIESVDEVVALIDDVTGVKRSPPPIPNLLKS